MTGKKPGGDKKATTVVANDPDDRKGLLKHIGGSRSDDWNKILAHQTVRTLWLKHSDKESCDLQCDAIIAGLMGIGPRDELIRTPSATATTQRTPLLKDAVWLP